MNDKSQIQQAYTKVLEYFIEHGRAPHYVEFAQILDIGIDEARILIRDTAAAAPIASCWLSHDTDYIESWAPFSNVPTHNRISVDGVQKWFGQGGMEVLAVRWLLPGKEIRLDTVCLDCGDPIVVRMLDDKILEIDPPSAVAYLMSPFAKWREGTGAFN